MIDSEVIAGSSTLSSEVSVENLTSKPGAESDSETELPQMVEKSDSDPPTAGSGESGSDNHSSSDILMQSEEIGGHGIPIPGRNPEAQIFRPAGNSVEQQCRENSPAAWLKQFFLEWLHADMVFVNAIVNMVLSSIFG